jgi:vacuolar-type H+-ATPase subunit E/Vma4
MAEVIGNVENLAAIIRRSAQQQALSEEADARSFAQQKLASAKKQAAEIKESMMIQARRQAEEEARRIGAQANLEAQRQRLHAREALLDTVWRSAENRLRDQPKQPAYADLLKRLAVFAAHILGPGSIRLAADPTGHALLTTECLERWTQEIAQDLPVTFVRAAQPAATWGGLVATAEDGRRQVDATFPTRLSLAQESLRERVAALLEVA